MSRAEYNDMLSELVMAFDDLEEGLNKTVEALGNVEAVASAMGLRTLAGQIELYYLNRVASWLSPEGQGNGLNLPRTIEEYRDELSGVIEEENRYGYPED